MNNGTCFAVDCSRGSWVSQLGVVLVSHPLRLGLGVRLSAQSTPPSARVFNVDGFSWVIRDILGRVVLVTEHDVFLGDVGVNSRSDGSRVRIAHVAEDEIVSSRERRARVYEMYGRTERRRLVRSR